jgi:hypothetical protein
MKAARKSLGTLLLLLFPANVFSIELKSLWVGPTTGVTFPATVNVQGYRYVGSDGNYLDRTGQSVTVSLAEYVKGVVESEYGDSFDPRAAKALAVIALGNVATYYDGDGTTPLDIGGANSGTNTQTFVENSSFVNYGGNGAGVIDAALDLIAADVVQNNILMLDKDDSTFIADIGESLFQYSIPSGVNAIGLRWASL